QLHFIDYSISLIYRTSLKNQHQITRHAQAASLSWAAADGHPKPNIDGHLVFFHYLCNVVAQGVQHRF
ncbi:MAG: hypothetical protein ACI4BG_07830, partial [Prevotella sp.]